MIDIWHDAEPANSRTSVQAAQWQSTVSRARQTLAETSGRTSTGKELAAYALPRRAGGTDGRG